MRRRLLWQIFGTALLLISARVPGQTMTVDLGSQKAGESQTVSVAPGKTIQLQILNTIPNKQYSVTALLQTKPIEPLDASAFSKTRTGGGEPPECKALQDALDSITAKGVSESSIPSLRASLKTALDNAAGNTCSAQAASALALAGTSRTLDESYNISAGQQLVVTVTRNGDDGKPLTWTKVFDGGSAGAWLVSYGFFFLPSGDKTYFSKPVVDPHGTPTGDYLVTQSPERQKYDFAPSVVFGWYPGWEYKGFSLALGAGLGFDLSAPIVSFGPLLTYNENIALTAGGVFR